MNLALNESISQLTVFRIPKSFFAPIVPELWNFVEGFPWNFRCKYEPAESKDETLLKLSEGKRQQLITHHADLPLATHKRNIRLPNGFCGALSNTLVSYLLQVGFTCSATISGSMIYPPGGWMGWHTNSDRPGWRLYVNYTAVGDRSFFRWSENGPVRTDYDSAGFTFRLFRIGSTSNLLWHCVYADDWRLSLGHRLGEVDVKVIGLMRKT